MRPEGPAPTTATLGFDVSITGFSSAGISPFFLFCRTISAANRFSGAMATGSSTSFRLHSCSQGWWQILPSTAGSGIHCLIWSRASTYLPFEMRATYPCPLQPAGQVSLQGGRAALLMETALGIACGYRLLIALRVFSPCSNSFIRSTGQASKQSPQELHFSMSTYLGFLSTLTLKLPASPSRDWT